MIPRRTRSLLRRTAHALVALAFFLATLGLALALGAAAVLSLVGLAWGIDATSVVDVVFVPMVAGVGLLASLGTAALLLAALASARATPNANGGRGRA